MDTCYKFLCHQEKEQTPFPPDLLADSNSN